jgi:hypothetical protein
MTDVLDRLGSELLRAEQTLYGMNHRRRVNRSSRVVSRLRSLSRRQLVVIVALVGASSVGGVAIASALSGTTLTDQQYYYEHEHAVPETAMTADQTADLAILRAPRTSADVIPANVAAHVNSTAEAQEDGVNVDLARFAVQTHGYDVWIAPGSQGLVCLIVAPVNATGQAQTPDSGGPCRPATSASASAVHACDGPNCNDSFVPGQTVDNGDLWLDMNGLVEPEVIVGVVPDGNPSVTLKVADGSSETLPVTNNVYAVALYYYGESPAYENLGESNPPADAPITTTITFNGPVGTVTAPIGVPGAYYHLTGTPGTPTPPPTGATQPVSARHE